MVFLPEQLEPTDEFPLESVFGLYEPFGIVVNFD